MMGIPAAATRPEEILVPEAAELAHVGERQIRRLCEEGGALAGSCRRGPQGEFRLDRAAFLAYLESRGRRAAQRRRAKEPAPPDQWVGPADRFRAALLAHGYGPATVDGYVRHVRQCGRGLRTDPWAVTSGELATWIDSQNWSKQTRNRVLSSLRLFYAWGVAEGYLKWAPTAGLKRSPRRRSGPVASPLPATWSDPVEAHLTACRAKALSDAAIEKRLMYLKRLSSVESDPWAVTTAQLEAFLANPQWAPATKRTARNQVVMFYRWAERAGFVESSPASVLATVRVPRSVPRPAPSAAVRTAIASCDDRVRLMLLLAALGGLRRAEIASLHCSQIADTHLIVQGKGGHVRMVPMDPNGDLAIALRAELQRRREGRASGRGWSESHSERGWLFPSTDPEEHLRPRAVGDLMAEALPDGYTAHQLRHRFATSAYAATRDLRAVQELLGHSKPETTARYAAVPDGALLAAVVGAGR